MLRYEDLSWHFKIHGPHDYELVLKDLNVPCTDYCFCTGYKSANLRDIIYAIWYLQDATYCIKLSLKQMQILDYIKNVSQIDFAAFSDPEAAAEI